MATETELGETLRRERGFMLWSELVALLHDLGKLSNLWYEYRSKWRKESKKYYDNDPHDHKFFDLDPLIRDKSSPFYSLRNMFDNCHPQVMISDVRTRKLLSLSKTSITDVVHEHTAENPVDMVKLVKFADIVDAAQDRNNPLFYAEQDNGRVFEGDIFGYERNEIIIEKIEDYRTQLYKSLQNFLPNYAARYDFKSREKILKAVKTAFDPFLSDTTRPNNDTSLWEHCLAVASITKALAAQCIIYRGELPNNPDEVRFGILGFGWDGLAFISRGQKIGDIVGRRLVLENLKEEIKKRIEWQYAFGNILYHDDNGVFFIVPYLKSEGRQEDREYNEFLDQVTDEVLEDSNSITDGDIQPQRALVKCTLLTTDIVDCIQEVRKQALSPIVGTGRSLVVKLGEVWEPLPNSTVCPVCLRRPVQKGEEVCKPCLIRRKQAASVRGSEQTVFVQEIGQANDKGGPAGRVAIIVAKFNILPWLKGDMLATLFVKPTLGLEQEIGELGETTPFKDEEAKRQEKISGRYNHGRIVREVGQCYIYENLTPAQKDCVSDSLFLYYRRNKFDDRFNEARRVWKSELESAKERWINSDLCDDELLANIVCAKTHTPSTVFDTWTTTLNFFQDLSEETNKDFLGLDKKDRIRVDIEKPQEAQINIPYDVEILGGKYEVVWRKEGSASIIGSDFNNQQKWAQQSARINVKDKRLKEQEIPISKCFEEAYYPFRVISASPEMFVVIVPADHALDITNRIYSKYQKLFGKVLGRLPLSIGNIFFDEKMPMFVALDAARRMVRNFEILSEKSKTMRVEQVVPDSDSGETVITVNQQLSTSHQRILEWHVPYQLGDSNEDFYHPYAIIESNTRDYREVSSYFKTVMGEVVLFSQLKTGDTLRVLPNYFDFEFLDSTVRRYDLILNNDRRTNAVGFNSKPYLMDDVKQWIQRLWNDIKGSERCSLIPGVTDTQLRRIEALLLGKLSEWDVTCTDCSSPAFQEWAGFVETTIKREFPVYRKVYTPEIEKDFHTLIEAILSGLFFDCLELHLRILKMRIRE